MSQSPTTTCDSLALFNVLRTLAQGTPEAWIELRRSAHVPGSDLAKLVASNNVSVQLNVVGTGADTDVLQSLALDNAALRQMLGEATCAGKPYTAMGEFNCTVEVPHIDYMRDAVSTLKDKLEKRRKARLETDKIAVDAAALKEVVSAFRNASHTPIVGLWAGMGLGHCAAGQLGRDLDHAVFNKTAK